MSNKLADAHWWGYAALPDGMEYPYTVDENPMHLVCQFHLDEGMVYVFADLDYFFGDLEAEGGHLGEWDEAFYKVLYSPTRENLHEHEVVDEEGKPAVPAAQAMDEPAKRGEESAVLCHPHCYYDELEGDYPDYQVLLELDECEPLGLRFYDCGMLFFLIRPNDLSARRFDHVKCALYSF